MFTKRARKRPRDSYLILHFILHFLCCTFCNLVLYSHCRHDSPGVTCDSSTALLSCTPPTLREYNYLYTMLEASLSLYLYSCMLSSTVCIRACTAEPYACHRSSCMYYCCLQTLQTPPSPFLLQRFSRLHQAAPTISSLPLSPRLLLKQLQLQLDEESLFQSPSKLGQQAILTPWFSVPWGEDAHQHYICIGLD